MKVLELFAGSRSIGKEAEKLGWEVFSSDWKPYENIHYIVDILNFNLLKMPFIPDIIWASPDCTTYSIAACSKHRKYIDGWPNPVSKGAKLADKVTMKMLEIINHIIEVNPNVQFFIENPRGLLRKMPFMKIRNITRHTVHYCSYGDNRMKPTDIWTNNNLWEPRSRCKRKATCHISSPRGFHTGTQGLKNPYERSIIPPELCREILMSCGGI